MEELFKLLEQLAERNQDRDQFKSEDVEGILKDPNVSLRLAVASAAGAQNRIAIAGGQPTRSQVEDATLCQAQSALWLEIHARQIEVEDRAKAARTAEIFSKQQEERLFGARLSGAFPAQNVNRPGFAKLPPLAKPDPEADTEPQDASSGNEDKPVT